ncbi:MAG: class I SAM-dependent methyltransferase [Desulfomonile tiedjei]|nr:class I SAM-dependent methyltransferase [Desulfomonile tiedjei]
MRRRSVGQQVVDFVTFPVRALALHGHEDRFGLTSLPSERFDYVSRHVLGYCLDVGCGRQNRFVLEFLDGNGKGIDVYPYEGLTEENLVEDMTHFPFPCETFRSVTFIANLNHIPRSARDAELAEAYRVLVPGGNIIVTMGRPLVEILVHKLVAFYDRRLHTDFDVDGERGMDDQEDYYVTRDEIVQRLTAAGFRDIARQSFRTQWCLNQLFVGWKPRAEPAANV